MALLNSLSAPAQSRSNIILMQANEQCASVRVSSIANAFSAAALAIGLVSQVGSTP